MALKQVHLVVRGRVQGVFFRASTQREAERLGTTGWVRNLPDGAVEIRAEGQEATLRQLVAWTHRGPDRARVDAVEEEWLSSTGDHHDFRIVD
jgi:acylphosphatase